MYVVRRAFRNYNQMVVPGSVIEPGTIKRFKARLRDGSIIEVNEQDFDKWNNYFKVRFGVAIQKNLSKATVKPVAEKPATKPVAEKPVAKATIKDTKQ